eukprot:CAMPEP_0184010754 /NCGR_PEP_ID=MMETSP0954-20121128/3409_1 /TAXON_ID=627963 /ORGANISM="Aplanochytrium sp, Strain PBS07" /LENGTH=476 /DNA_ID=CAMNT_0026290419 /DNA_START=78 /DNA_END=1511 /DNA_ORIENTATION=+
MEHLVKSELKTFSGNCFLPGSDGYAAAVATATSENFVMVNRKPCIYLQPKDTQDVVTAVNFVLKAISAGVLTSKVPLTVCGGGHSELGVMTGSVLLHMSLLNSIECYPSEKKVTFGSGITLGPLSRAVGKHGMAVPIGTWETVGCGLVLQGGVGHLTRFASLTADNILEVEAVLPNGEVKILNANSKGDDEELFWAIRGAGPAFAVVTRITLNAFPVKSLTHVRSIRTLTNASSDAQYLRKCEKVLRALPNHQSCDIIIGSGDKNTMAVGLFPMSLNGKEFENSVMKTLEFSSSDIQECKYYEYPGGSLVDTAGKSEGDDDVAFAAQTAAGVLTYMRNLYVDELSDEAWKVLIEYFMKRPTDMCSIALQHTGGAVRTTEAGSFKCRNFEFSLVIGSLWMEGSNMREKCMQWADELWDAMLPYGTGTYPADVDNFRRPDKVESELRLAFGENLERMRALKLKVDPSNILKGTYALID